MGVEKGAGGRGADPTLNPNPLPPPENLTLARNLNLNPPDGNRSERGDRIHECRIVVGREALVARDGRRRDDLLAQAVAVHPRATGVRVALLGGDASRADRVVEGVPLGRARAAAGAATLLGIFRA